MFPMFRSYRLMIDDRMNQWCGINSLAYFLPITFERNIGLSTQLSLVISGILGMQYFLVSWMSVNTPWLILTLPLIDFQSILFHRARWPSEDVDVKRSCLLLLYDYDLCYASCRYYLGKLLRAPSHTLQRVSNDNDNFLDRLNGSS